MHMQKMLMPLLVNEDYWCRET